MSAPLLPWLLAGLALPPAPDAGTEPLFRLAASARPVTALAFAPDGKTLAVGGQDRTVGLWDLSRKQRRATLELQAWVQALAFAPDGKLLAGAGHGPAVRLWDPAAARPVGELRVPHGGWNLALAWSADGVTLIAGTGTGGGCCVRVWHVADRKLLSQREAEFRWVYAVAHAADGQGLVFASRDGVGRIRSPGARAPLRLGYKFDHGDLAALSADGRRFAAVCRAGQLLLGPVGATRNDVRELESAKGATALAFSPDGRLLAAGHDSGRVRLYDARDGRVVRTLVHGKKRVEAVAFSRDGKTLATAAADGSVALWRAPLPPPKRR